MATKLSFQSNLEFADRSIVGGIHDVIINDVMLILFIPDLVYRQRGKWNIQTLLIGDSLSREAVGFDKDSKQIMQILNAQQKAEVSLPI